MTAISHTNRHGRGVMKIYASPAPLKLATTTTSCVDHYKMKTKQEISPNPLNSRNTEWYNQRRRS